MALSLKTWAALATGLVFSLIILTLAFLAQYYAYFSLRNLLQNQQDAVVKLAAQQANEKFKGRAIVLRRVARQLAPLLDRSPDELMRLTMQAVSMPEAFNAVSLIWPDGELAFNTATPEVRHLSLADRDYVREIVDGASLAVSEPLVGKNNGAPAVVMAVGLHGSDGKLRAIVAGSLNLLSENFLQELAYNRVGATGTFCLISSGADPRYVMHTDVSNILKGAKPTGDSCGTDVPDGQTSALEFIYPHRPIVSRYLLDTNGWELVATFPAAEAYAPLHDVRRKLIFAVGIAVAFAAILMWVVSYRLLRPLAHLHRLVQRNAEARLMQPALQGFAGDEISDLTLSFSAFIQELIEREAALVQAKDEAKENEARIHAVANRVPGLVSYVGTDERFVYVNEAYERRFGLPASKIVGLSVKELWGAATYDELKPYLDRAFSGERVLFEKEFTDRQPSQWMEVLYQPAMSEAGDSVKGVHVFKREVTESRSKMLLLERQALSDHLTGLLNRKGFDRCLRAAMSTPGDRPLALLLVDLDNFKPVNDQHGHAMGDQLLEAFSARLLSCMRKSDAAARIGGDEFAIILDDVSPLSVVDRIANDIIKLSGEPYTIDGQYLRVTASVGVAVRRPGDDVTASELFLKADTELYAAKRAGKSRVSNRAT